MATLDVELFGALQVLLDRGPVAQPGVEDGAVVAEIGLDEGAATGAVQRIRCLRVGACGLGQLADLGEYQCAVHPQPGAGLINLSFGGVAAEDAPPRVIQYALALLSADVEVVCSAGNFGDAQPHWPAAFDRVTTVGAAVLPPADLPVRTDPTAAPFSCRGDWVDAYAQGVDVLGPYCTFSETAAGAEALGVLPQEFTGWARWNGTSFAAAKVTGMIAREMADHPELTAREASDQHRKAATSKVNGVPLLLPKARPS
ncbi:S8 family serine peptidase [Pseudonocardia sp. GCM10023141]|uniref:S8 family serine peptidase n=1 Tax=Pseudonocardia sp. GCM10023141 TaxID=3252653 RepID=UPI003610B9EB